MFSFKKKIENWGEKKKKNQIATLGAQWSVSGFGFG